MIYIKSSGIIDVEGVCAALTREFDPSFVYSGESHGFAELFFVDEGEVEVVENERTYMLSAQDLIIHAPGEFHRLRSAGGTAPKTITLCFILKNPLPERLTDGVLHLSAPMVAELKMATELLHASLGHNFDGGTSYDEIIPEYAEAPMQSGAEEAMLRLGALLISLCKLNTSEASISRTEGAMLYRKMVRTMTERARVGLSLAELSAIHHISESYVKKLFRSYAGEAPSVYFTRLRISEAKKLLDMGLSVCEVAEAMHFSSPAYFSAYFKRNTGIPAKEYRRKRYASSPQES